MPLKRVVATAITSWPPPTGRAGFPSEVARDLVAMSAWGQRDLERFAKEAGVRLDYMARANLCLHLFVYLNQISLKALYPRFGVSSAAALRKRIARTYDQTLPTLRQRPLIELAAPLLDALGFIRMDR